MTQVELARKLSLESPTVVRLLDRLGEHGWIERRPCPKDRRAYHVELTPRARRLCVDIDRVVTEVRRQGLSGIPAQDLAMAISVLERARDGFARLAETLKAQEAVAPGRRKTSAASLGRTRKTKPTDRPIE